MVGIFWSVTLLQSNTPSYRLSGQQRNTIRRPTNPQMVSETARLLFTHIKCTLVFESHTTKPVRTSCRTFWTLRGSAKYCRGRVSDAGKSGKKMRTFKGHCYRTCSQSELAEWRILDCALWWRLFVGLNVGPLLPFSTQQGLFQVVLCIIHFTNVF